nr:LytS/YhcK type 5TM receptor domain-containing protein [Pallidibacillus pasinlerensis]
MIGRINMFTLVPFMIEKIGIILIVALLLSQLRSFRKIIQNEQSQKDKVLLLFLFGLFGIISNYTGIEVFDRNTEYLSWHSFIDNDDAIANTRVLGIVIGGLIGGPVVGMGAGLIAGIHRYFLGGFTAFACSISTIIAGVLQDI